MIIRLTKKLAQKLHETELAELPLDQDPRAEWLATVFEARGTPLILLMNSVSRYVVLIPDDGIADRFRFLCRAREEIDASFTRNGIPDSSPGGVSSAGQISIAKATDPSRIASLSHAVGEIKQLISSDTF